MFDFEKLIVYQKAKSLNKDIYFFTQHQKALNSTLREQLRRASLSIMLNIAEGASRFTSASKRNYYIIARGSAFECVAIWDLLKELEMAEPSLLDEFYGQCEEISKMLFKLIRQLE